MYQDRLSPKLATLKVEELINTLPHNQAALNRALAKLSNAGGADALLAAKRACQEIQIVIGTDQAQ